MLTRWCAVLASVVLTVGPVRGVAQSPAPPVPLMSRASFDSIFARVNNAGRWGAQDQVGTLNLITPAKRRAAAALVREGVTVSLARIVRPGATPNVISPLHVTNTISHDKDVTWFVDSLTWLFHGWGFSHMDATAHTMYRGLLYNGVRSAEITVAAGATRLGIDALRQGIVTRGVLVDLPRLKGVPYLEPGTPVTAEDLAAWEKKTGVRVEPGDVLLIRTGRWAREKALGVWDVTKIAAGPHPSLALWLHARGVSALGGDVSSERYPPVVPGLSDPLHELALVGMGMPLFDALDFEELARVAADKSRWTFLFVVAPLAIRNGSGSPVNPLAIF